MIILSRNVVKSITSPSSKSMRVLKKDSTAYKWTGSLVLQHVPRFISMMTKKQTPKTCALEGDSEPSEVFKLSSHVYETCLLGKSRSEKNNNSYDVYSS